MNNQTGNGAPAPQAPANIEAEEAVLGSLLIDSDAIINVAGTLQAGDFYREVHGYIYQAIMDLHERQEPADVVTVVDELAKRGQLQDVGGAAAITRLVNAVPTAVHAEYYAGIVARESTLRRLIGVGTQVVTMAYGPDITDADAVVDRAEQLIFSLAERRIRGSVYSLADVTSEVVDHLSKVYQAHADGRVLGIPTGFRGLDKILGGWQKSDLIILAARPATGKSALAAAFALNAAKKHRQQVLFFSLEMSREQLCQRMIASETQIPQQRLRQGDITPGEWDLIMAGASTLSEQPFFIDDTPALTLPEMRTRARRLQAERGVDLIIVDYLQLMGSTDRRVGNREQEVATFSRGLKGLARELNVPVIALAQLSRAVEQRSDHKPVLSDLRESGSLEADSDVVLLLYAEDQYKEDTDRKNVVDVIVAKQRNGPTDTVPLYFNRTVTAFGELEMHREPLN